MANQSYPLEVDVTEANKLTQAGPGKVQIIDVREPDERATCAIEGSRHIPMRQIPEVAASLPRDQQLLILCHHGGRSMRVTQFLRANGFENATNIAGGIDAWAQQIEPGMKRY
jgi:rhodanese-related sulfurtransferase